MHQNLPEKADDCREGIPKKDNCRSWQSNLFCQLNLCVEIIVALRASIVFVVLFGDVIWEYLIASYTKTIVTMKVEKTVPATKNRGRCSFGKKVSPQADWVVAECQTSPSIPGHKVLKHDTLTLHCTQYAFDMVEMAEICFWHGWNDRDIFEVGSPVPWVTLAHWLQPRGHLRGTSIAVSTHVMLN